MRQQFGKSVQRGARGFVHGQNTAQFDVGVVADKDRCQTDEAVHRRDKLRHFCHLHPLRHDKTDGPAARDQDHRQEPEARARADQRGKDRQRHPDDAVPDRALCALLPGQTAQ